jgi:hypothetical protein
VLLLGEGETCAVLLLGEGRTRRRAADRRGRGLRRASARRGMCSPPCCCSDRERPAPCCCSEREGPAPCSCSERQRPPARCVRLREGGTGAMLLVREEFISIMRLTSGFSGTTLERLVLSANPGYCLDERPTRNRTEGIGVAKLSSEQSSD